AKALLAWANFEAAVLLIERLASPPEVALFTGAARPAGLLVHPFVALAWVFLPAMAHEESLGRERLVPAGPPFHLIPRPLAPAAMPGCLVIGRFLLGAFGSAYARSAPVLLLLTVAYTVYFGPVNGLPLVVLRRERGIAISSIVALAIIIAGAIALVPRHGAV